MKTNSIKWLLCAVFLGLVGCSSSSNDDSDETELRVMNFITDSDQVNFQIDEDDYATINYRSTSTFSNQSGEVSFDLELIDDDGNSTTLVNNTDVTLNGGLEFSLIAVGSSTDPVLMVVEAVNDDPTEDFTKLQFVNTTEQSLTVVMSAENDGEELYSATIASRSYDDSFELLSESVEFTVTNADGTVLLDSTSYSLETDGDVTAILADYQGPGGNDFSVDLLIFDDNGSSDEISAIGRPASIRFINAITGLSADGVEITVTDSLEDSTVAAVDYLKSSSRDVVDGGAYTISISPSDAPGTNLYFDDVNVIGGYFYTYLLTGDMGDPDVTLLTEELRAVATRAQATIYHASESLSLEDDDTDIYIASFTDSPLSGQIVSSFPYKTSQEFQVVSNIYNITATTEDSTSIIAGPFNIELVDGDIVDVILHDDQLGGGQPDFSIVDTQ